MQNFNTPRFALALALCGAVLPLSIVGCSGGNGILNSPSGSTTAGSTTAGSTTAGTTTAGTTTAGTTTAGATTAGTTTAGTTTAGTTTAGTTTAGTTTTAGGTTAGGTTTGGSGKFTFSGDLVASQQTGDFSKAPLKPFNFSMSGELTGNSSGAQRVDLKAASGAFAVVGTESVRHDFEFGLRSSATGANVPFTKNQSINLKSGNDLITITQFNVSNDKSVQYYSVYLSNSGEAIIREIGPSSIKIELKNALFGTLVGNAGVGSVIINGTVTATNLTVK